MLEVGGRHACKRLELGDKSGARTIAHTIAYGFDGEVAVLGEIAESAAGFLDAILVEQLAEVLACALINNLRHIIIIRANE